MNLISDKNARRYSAPIRDLALALTQARIVDAALQLLGDTFVAELTLRRVARTAGVTQQTVLNHFGSKRGLLRAAFAEGKRRVAARRRAEPRDPAEAVRILLGQHEELGDAAITALAQEARDPHYRRIIPEARRRRRAWLARAFAPLFAGLKGSEREARRLQLYAVTDVYVWKLLRRDLGLPRARVEQLVQEMVRRVGGLDGD